MHFDDAEKPFLNLGTAMITSIAGANTASIESDGKFGNCLNTTTGTIEVYPTQEIGGKDFSFEYCNKTNGAGYFHNADWRQLYGFTKAMDITQ